MRGCILCNLQKYEVRTWDADVQYKGYDCPRCGQYWIELGLEREKISKSDAHLWEYLPAYTRQESANGNLPKLTTENWKNYAQAHAHTSVLEKQRRLLELIEARTKLPFTDVRCEGELDYPLIDASSMMEFNFYAGHLQSSGFAKFDIFAPLDHALIHQANLTVQGWEKLEASRTGSGIPDRCFVAMAFAKEMESAYETGIVPAVVKDCGLPAPIRVDREEHNDQITDRIVAEIRKAEFVIADFTLQSGGVYFEAGFALGLGRPVIYTCREDHFEKVHFDTRQYNHIVWKSPQELRERLRDRIQATIITKKKY